MKILTQNLGVKIFALLCAIFLWIYVAAGESKVAYFPGNLPIEAKNTPTGLAAIYDQQKIRVKLQAPYEIWNRIGIDNLSALIDLAGLEEGTHELEVKVSVNLPNIVIVEKEPDKIIVRLELVSRKEIPVAVKFEGEAKTGFVPGEVVIKPEKVEIKGAKSQIENIFQAEALIKLSGEEEDFKKTVTIAVYNEKNEKQSGLEFKPETVDVEVPIVPASESKTVGVKPKVKGRPRAEYFVSKIEVVPATVAVSGSSSNLKSLLYLETKEIDIEGIEKDLERDVELSSPSGISLKEKRVRIKITLAANNLEREINGSLAYANLASGLLINSVSPSTIKVVVSCPASVINNLSPSQVVITFNLSGKTAGSHFTNISKDMLSLPENCSASSWLPSAATIVLQ